MRVCVEVDPLTDPLTTGHGRNPETRVDRRRPVSFPFCPSASTGYTLPTVRNQQVSGSSSLADSNLAPIERAASDPVWVEASPDRFDHAPRVSATDFPGKVIGGC